MPRKATRLAAAALLAFGCGTVSRAAQQPSIASAAIPSSTAASRSPLTAPPRNSPPFPLEEIRRGMHGTAWTVFEGTDPEPMDVEILGRLKNAIGPGQDMILARLHGTKPEFTGIVAGMSGSPVYIDGKLVGALGFRIGQFSKEPICGITPIGLMLEVRDLRHTAPVGSSARTAPLPFGLQHPSRNDSVQEHAGLENPEHEDPGHEDPEHGAASHNAASSSSPAFPGNPVSPIATPLVFNGFSPETVARYAGNFRALGLEPVTGLGSSGLESSGLRSSSFNSGTLASSGTGSASRGSAPATAVVAIPSVVPGSAISAILVRGDLNIAATCTVTYVDAKQLLACGHPLTQYGDIDIPMTRSEVLATLPSPLNAFKIVNSMETIGAFTEDRANAIAGTFGSTASMIPVTVDLAPIAGSGLPSRTLHFEVLQNRQLTPQIMLAGIFQALTKTNTSGTEMSLRLDGELAVDGHTSVRLSGTVSSDSGPAAAKAAMYIASRFSQVYGNPLEQPRIRSVRIHAEVVPTPRSAQVESARISTDEANPGDTLYVEATVRPYQAPVRIVRLPVRLPTTLESGPLRILVGDAASLDRILSPPPASAQHALGLSDTIAQLNQEHSNDRVYVTLLDHQTQGITAAASLPSLPPDMVNALQPLRNAREISFTSETATEIGSLPMDAAISGSQVLTVNIR